MLFQLFDEFRAAMLPTCSIKCAGAVGLFVIFALCAATANEPSPLSVSPSAEEIAVVKQHNARIVANTPEADGVFAVRDDGSVGHSQSGMICPATFPNVAFWHAEVFRSNGGKGEDVGCDYGRNGPDGKWVSKLTIFATKAPSGIALDDVFARYRKELLTTYSDAVPTAPALTIGKDKDGSAVDYRAAAYDVVGKTGSTHEELIVGLTGDWMLEVRASYPHAGIVVKNPNDKVDLRNQLFDIQSPYLAFLSAEKSLKNAVAAKPGKN